MALEMKYFILKPHGHDEHAAASRVAMRAYAHRIQDHDPEMSKALRIWAYNESTKACKELEKG